LLLKAGNLTVYREVKGSEGFGATNPYRVHFGMGKHNKIDSLEIRWPSGVKQIFRDLESNRINAVRENSPAILRLQ
jgi:hypothetical protein